MNPATPGQDRTDHGRTDRGHTDRGLVPPPHQRPPPGRSPFARVGIVGCGLMGGSLALATRGMDGIEEVVVTDRHPAVRAEARRREVATVADTVAEVAASSDLVVAAVPVAAIPPVLVEAARHAAPGAVLTDVGSVKSTVVREVEALLAPLSGGTGRQEPTRGGGQPQAAQKAEQPAELSAQGDLAYVGGHPMVGSEAAGLSAADATMFQGATYVLTPTARSSPAALKRLAGFLRVLGAQVLTVDPGTHDRLVGLVSHLPQVLASTLMVVAGQAARVDAGVLAMAGRGFRDVTRLAASDAELWAGILRDNRTAVLDALDLFVGELERVRVAVANRRWGEVEALLDEAHAARIRLPGKEMPGRVVDVVVPVEDRPGTLAAVTTALGAAGINIEDISMRHAERPGRGALVVAVVGEEVAAHARQVLGEQGFASHLEAR